MKHVNLSKSSPINIFQYYRHHIICEEAGCIFPDYYIDFDTSHPFKTLVGCGEMIDRIEDGKKEISK